MLEMIESTTDVDGMKRSKIVNRKAYTSVASADIDQHEYTSTTDSNSNSNPDDDESSPKRPSLLLIHGAIITAQIAFGSGSVIGALGLPETNPVLFALIREGIAGPLLCIIALIIDGKKNIPKLRHIHLFIGPGLSLFCNQLFFITGLKLSSSITASAWQPSQAILAVIYGWCLNVEHNIDIYKILGILSGTCGALFMILFRSNDTNTMSTFDIIGGNICFFINCSTTALYLIFGKRLLEIYPSATVTGYSYICATILMTITAFTVASSEKILHFLCHDCHGAWEVPTETIYALAYWILGQSLLSYLLMTWANQYAAPSINLAYTVLQPLTSTILSQILIYTDTIKRCTKNNSDNCLYAASWNDLGAIGIVIGLYFVIYSDRKYRQKMIKLGINSQTDLLNENDEKFNNKHKTQQHARRNNNT